MRAIVLVCAGLALLGYPPRADAQHEAFVEALADLASALPGTYGDEGSQVQAALDRLERGLADWDQTLREYESNVIAVRPTASSRRVLDMHAAMGTFYVRRGRIDDAIRELDAAVALAPDWPQLHLFRGLVHAIAGRPMDALAAYGQAWTLSPDDPVAAYMLAEASLRSPSAPLPAGVLVTLAETVDRIAAGAIPGQPDPFIETALLPDDRAQTPQFAPALYARAFALVERGEYAAAIGALRDAASRDPLVASPVSPVMRRGSEALRDGRVGDAIEQFAEAVREAPGAEPHRLLGVAHWLAAEYERSIEHLEEAIRLDATDERSRLTLARVLDEIDETERTERLLVETSEVLPSSGLTRWRLGRMYAAASRTEDALREYTAAAGHALLAGGGPLHLEIGALHRRNLDAPDAEAAFATAVALRPNQSVPHRERGRALLHLNRTDAAFVELAAAVLVDPGDYESWLTIAQLHLDAERYAEAVRALTHATGIERDNPDAYYALAAALIRDGRREEAAPHLETFARLRAQAVEAHRRQIDLSALRLEAGMLADTGQLDRAVELWTQILADEPSVAANHEGLAAALVRLERLETAAAHYEKAAALGGSVNTYRRLAALYDTMGRPEARARTSASLARRHRNALGVTVTSDRR